jgi:hypothetical protein
MPTRDESDPGGVERIVAELMALNRKLDALLMDLRGLRGRGVIPLPPNPARRGRRRRLRMSTSSDSGAGSARAEPLHS